MQLIELVLARAGLDILGKAALPFREAYAVMRLRGACAENLAFYDAERMKLFERLGERKGELYTIPKEREAEFIRAERALLATEIDMDVRVLTVTVPVEGLTADMLAYLQPFVNFKTEEVGDGGEQ